jgi:Glycosyltransferase family 87
MSPTTRALILGITAILIGLPLLGWASFLLHVVPDGHADFRANYTAGYLLRTGQPLYDYALEVGVQNQKVSHEEVALPFIHPAYEALLYVPLSFLTYLQAYWVWFAVNLIILVSVYRLLRPELGALSVVAIWLPVGAFAAFMPIGAAVVQGQDALLLLLLLALAFAYFRSSEHLFVAGMFLGLAVFRFHIVLPIIVCFLFWKRWKVVIGFLVTASSAAALSVAVAGFWPYVSRMLVMGMQPDAAYYPPVSSMPNLRGLIESLGAGRWTILIASLAILGVTVLAGSRCQLQQQLSLGVTAATLVGYHGLVHDLSILFIPFALLIGSKRQGSLIIAGICFLVPSLLMFTPTHFYLTTFALLALLFFLATPEHQWSAQSQVELSPH